MLGLIASAFASAPLYMGLTALVIVVSLACVALAAAVKISDARLARVRAIRTPMPCALVVSSPCTVDMRRVAALA